MPRAFRHFHPVVGHTPQTSGRSSPPIGGGPRGRDPRRGRARSVPCCAPPSCRPATGSARPTARLSRHCRGRRRRPCGRSGTAASCTGPAAGSGRRRSWQESAPRAGRGGGRGSLARRICWRSERGGKNPLPVSYAPTLSKKGRVPCPVRPPDADDHLGEQAPVYPRAARLAWTSSHLPCPPRSRPSGGESPPRALRRPPDCPPLTDPAIAGGSPVPLFPRKVGEEDTG
jgi:hypothetical protein